MLNFANRTLFRSDNLPILRGMNSETVDLIATDPPFNKGRDFHATPESLAAGARFQDRWSWERDVHEEWVDAIRDDKPALWHVIQLARESYGEDMAAFLCFMGVRVMEMHRILKPTGSLVLHCDPTASHYLKAMLDAVFGKRNFKNEIVWERIKGAGKASKGKPKAFGTATDSLFAYTRSKEAVWNPDAVALPYPDLEKTFGRRDEKGVYKRRSPFRPPGLGAAPNLMYEYKGVFPPHSSGWIGTREFVENLDRIGDLEWLPDGRVYRKQRPSVGIRLSNLWTDIPQAGGKERVGYPTQKPLALYERIIAASSNEGDMVLDPFAGCATTVIAAERLRRQWVGIDLWEGLRGVVTKRMEQEGLTSGVTYTERPPERTDDGDFAAPDLYTPTRRRPLYAWERLTRREMRDHLLQAQGYEGEVACAGCGRVLEPEFMEIDHINPRSDGGANTVDNRILLCRPCNGRKSNGFTLTGLLRANKKEGWMKDARKADVARQRVQILVSKLRDAG